jgi:hypothetical protein
MGAKAAGKQAQPQPEGAEHEQHSYGRVEETVQTVDFTEGHNFAEAQLRVLFGILRSSGNRAYPVRNMERTDIGHGSPQNRLNWQPRTRTQKLCAHTSRPSVSIGGPSLPDWGPPFTRRLSGTRVESENTGSPCF